MYAVTVTLTLKENQHEAFMYLMLENAHASLANEPGCQRFDVCADPNQPKTVFLYELYDDQTAFQAHLASKHFQAFDTFTADMVVDKQVHCFSQVFQ
ncbi:putative quinol monooxygenase [Parasulfitobacter algicola]|uniref:Antibiotic biosynthesis monooxygenase n=1 Tax=Parasulfitobacter algicola TaxID=2614809 RepID=A0ABX2ILB5_9RHOB|nr:putative quinol monooxygenase [Sulfitobacter algicola]NSX53644.1 antibiotic biosynthesis monooxygenase [Sulfitobacter algicola]